MVLVASDDSESGYRCGELALKLMGAFVCKELTARTHASVYGFLSCYKNPIRESIRHLRDAYRLNIMTGDVEVRVRLGCSTCWKINNAPTKSKSFFVCSLSILLDSFSDGNYMWIDELWPQPSSWTPAVPTHS
jgi:hypothetical protein